MVIVCETSPEVTAQVSETGAGAAGLAGAAMDVMLAMLEEVAAACATTPEIRKAAVAAATTIACLDISNLLWDDRSKSAMPWSATASFRPPVARLTSL
jgi:hypothetical protein